MLMLNQYIKFNIAFFALILKNGKERIDVDLIIYRWLDCILKTIWYGLIFSTGKWTKFLFVFSV